MNILPKMKVLLNLFIFDEANLIIWLTICDAIPCSQTRAAPPTVKHTTRFAAGIQFMYRLKLSKNVALQFNGPL